MVITLNEISTSKSIVTLFADLDKMALLSSEIILLVFLKTSKLCYSRECVILNNNVCLCAWFVRKTLALKPKLLSPTAAGSVQH